MPARSAIITPLEFSGLTQAARRIWRKKILPVGDILYDGVTYNFDMPMLQSIVDSFRDRAFDQVPLQLATAENKHNNLPERFSGELIDVELSNDGLWGVIQTTDKGTDLIKENPKLGVSARIVQEHFRADGKYYPNAIQHVLATLDPRLTGLGEWQAIEMSNSDTECATIDLSGAEFREINTVPFTEDEITKLRTLLASSKDDKDDKVEPGDKDAKVPPNSPPSISPDAPENGGTGNPPASTPGDNGTGTTGTAGAGEDPQDQLSDAELDELLREAEADLGGDPDREGDLVGAELSNAYQKALELANAELDDQRTALSAVQNHVNQQKFDAEKAMFVREYNIPPRIVDLAKPLLWGDPKVIDLANGETADYGSIARQMLTEFGGLAKMFDLGNEMGSGVEGDVPANAELIESTKTLRSLLSL